MDPEIYLLKIRIVELESENEKLKQLVKPKVPPPPIQGDASVKELVDQSDIHKLRCGVLVQGRDSVGEYYSKIKGCNEIVKYSEDFLWHEFIKGLTPENKICAENIKSRPTFDELVERLIQELR
ncbi:2741_t:CDS:1, partial [Funneliformis geosporum]